MRAPSDPSCIFCAIAAGRAEAALQTAPHMHLHVIPRHAGDGWTLGPEDAPARDRDLPNQDAAAIREALGTESST